MVSQPFNLFNMMISCQALLWCSAMCLRMVSLWGYLFFHVCHFGHLVKWILVNLPSENVQMYSHTQTTSQVSAVWLSLVKGSIRWWSGMRCFICLQCLSEVPHVACNCGRPLVGLAFCNQWTITQHIGVRTSISIWYGDRGPNTENFFWFRLSRCCCLSSFALLWCLFGPRSWFLFMSTWLSTTVHFSTSGIT